MEVASAVFRGMTVVTAPVTNYLEKGLTAVGLEYYFREYWDEWATDYSKRYRELDGGPWHMLTVVGIYVLIVKWIGPYLMRNRKPFVLRYPILIYNLLMVAINSWIFNEIIWSLRFGTDTWGCLPELNHSARDDRYMNAMYIFAASKFVELLDTIFFVLRKKYTQISPLHVVHHATVPLVCYLMGKYVDSKAPGWFPMLNTLIHSLMYAYYALSALGPQIQKYLWWKKYLTQLQLLQFVLILIHPIHFLLLPSGCGNPRVFIICCGGNAIMYLVLFSNFYLQSYLTKPVTVVVTDVGGIAARNGNGVKNKSE